MLKLRFGNQVINLIKSVKGSEKPGHLYCKRVPLATGGYDYYYRTSNGKCGDSNNEKKTYTNAEARKAHPEHFTPLESKFLALHQDVKDIIFHKFSNLKNSATKKAIDKIRKNFESANRDSYHGYAWEAFYLLHKEIGSGHIRDINDAAEYLNSIYDDSNDEKKAMIDRFFNIYTAIHDIETSEFNGVNYMNSLWHDAGKAWNYIQANVEEMTNGRPPDPSKWIVQPISRKTGQDINGDYILMHPDLPEFMNAVSLKKVSEGGVITNKEGTWETGAIEHYVESAVPSINILGQKMMKAGSAIRAAGKKSGASQQKINETISAAMAQIRHDHIFKNPDNSAEFATYTIDLLHKLHSHAGATETVLIGRVVKKDGTSYSRGVRVSQWNKALDKRVSKSLLTWQQNQTGTMKGVDGKNYIMYGGLSLYMTDTKTGAKRKLVGLEHRSDNRHQMRMPEPTWSDIAGDIERENAASANLIAIHNGLMPTRQGIMGFQRSVPVALFKAVATTERKKMNAKYIRKELTESGRVRYIYRETNPRSKRADEPEPIRRNQFLSLVDATDPEYKTLFNDSISEIDDAHFTSINAGCSSIRIAKDVETFLDTLGVPPELKSKEEFMSASGSFNVNKGKMAFCTSNFPEDVSEIMKKAVMMHEVGHGFFYGTLRIKHKKPLTADAVDSKDKDQKMLVKNAIKFVDTFGKMDEEIRKKAEFDVEGIKGQDKEALMQESIKTYMVSEYATLSSEEHFAEAFSRYFIMPEQLKKKEKEVYDHFEAYFQKYGG